MTSLRAPADKLPLTARKNLRDEWESKKSEYEAKMGEVLGEAWTIELNANLIYQYADESYKARLGSVIVWYMDPFIDNLKRFAHSFGEDGKQELNSVCSKHVLTLGPQEKTKFSYGGLVIEDGVLRLVFQEDNLGTNTSDVSQNFEQALKDAPATAAGGSSSALNLIGRNGIREEYNPDSEEVRTAIAGAVNMPGLKLNGNFEKNAAELAMSGEQQGWDKRLGWMTLKYFQSLQYVLEREKFKDDDMQQEAFQEAVENGEVCVRILPKLPDGMSRYGGLHIEDGVLYIQTTSEHWGTNIDDVAVKLLDIL